MTVIYLSPVNFTCPSLQEFYILLSVMGFFNETSWDLYQYLLGVFVR